jgi:PAS domain S-box-containing protein
MRLLRRLHRWWGDDLRRRLLLSNAVVILLLGAILGYLSYRVGRSGVRAEVLQRNAQVAVLVAKDINSQLDNIFDNVHLFTYQLEGTSEMLPLQARAMLEFRRASPLTYRALYLFDREGSLLIHVAEPLEALLEIENVDELLERPPIPVSGQVARTYEMAHDGSMFLAGTFLEGPDRAPVIYMGIPLVVAQRGSGQIVVAEIDLRDVWRRIDEVEVGETGHAYVVSQSGTIIAHPDRAQVGTLMPVELMDVLKGIRGHAEYVDERDGRKKYACFSPVGSPSGWGVVVEQDASEALATVNRIGLVTVLVLSGAMVVSFLLAVLTARSVVRPIARLVESTRQIADTGDLEHPIDLTTRGEVGQLAVAFKQMIVRLRRAQTEVLRLNRDLEHRVEVRTEELRESEARYRAIVQDQTELIWRALPDGTLTFANDAFCRYFGHHWEALAGHNILLLLNGEDVAAAETALGRRSPADPVEAITVRVELDGGQVRWHKWTLRAVLDADGVLTEIQGVGWDITEELQAQTALRQAKEEAEAGSRAKDEFLANMSHELRTPLNAVLGLTEVLQEEVYGSLTEKQTKSLDTIDASGRHLLALINDILDVSRIEGDSLRLEISQVSVTEVCHVSLELVRQQALKKGIEVLFDGAQAPRTMGADERRLVQILVNLLSNAVKFTAEGGRVGLDVTSEDDGAVVSFTVWDTGIGIAETEMHKLFRPFVQLDMGLSRRYGGTGLGLLLAYRLTERHGGSIGVESEPGKGSRFSVWLPVESAVEGAPADVSPAADPAVDSDEGGVRLLIFNRFPGGCVRLGEGLCPLGYTVKTTRNGAEVAALVREWAPRLALVCAENEMEARGCMEYLKSGVSGLTLPAVVCVSLTMPGDAERLYAEGVGAYFRAPVTTRRLQQAIEQVTRNDAGIGG